MRYYITALPVGRNINRAAIGSNMILFNRHFRRIGLKIFPPSVTDVDILRLTVTVQFPDSWHGHRAPPFVIVVCPIKICRPTVGIGYPVKFPYSVKT